MDAGAAPPPPGRPDRPGPPPRPPPAPHFRHTAQVHLPVARSCVPPAPPPQPQTPHRQSPPPRHRSSPLPPPITSQREMISLDMVRDGPRASNEYVDNPTVASSRVPSHSPTVALNGNSHCLHPQETTRLPVPPITSQPSVKKDTSFNLDMNAECKSSIICPQCHKCRCGQCTGKKELPSHWFCNKKCELSVQKCVDYASCLCAVRCVFYHCCSNVDGDTVVSAADEPCACCEIPNCCKRWTCLGLMSIALPCLCLYWPMKLMMNSCTFCYNRCCRRQGCHCRQDRVPGSKHLLLDSESSSA